MAGAAAPKGKHLGWIIAGVVILGVIIFLVVRSSGSGGAQVINPPNNPTGTDNTASALQELGQLAGIQVQADSQTALAKLQSDSALAIAQLQAEVENNNIAASLAASLNQSKIQGQVAENQANAQETSGILTTLAGVATAAIPYVLGNKPSPGGGGGMNGPGYNPGPGMGGGGPGSYGGSWPGTSGYGGF